MMGQRRKEGSEMLKEQSEKQAGPGCVGYIDCLQDLDRSIIGWSYYQVVK